MTSYCSGDKIKKNEMGGVYSTYGGEVRRIQGFGGETGRKETTWENPGADVRIIIRWIFRKWDVGVSIGSS